jgi:hypothetical protein
VGGVGDLNAPTLAPLAVRGRPAGRGLPVPETNISTLRTVTSRTTASERPIDRPVQAF